MTRKSRSDIERAASRSRQAMLKAASPVLRANRSGPPPRQAKAPAVPPTIAGQEVPRVWVIYARENGDLASALIHRLRGDGLDVTWDRDLPPGVDYDQHIEEAIRGCDKAVAIWSADALRSRFVLDEATLALELGKLVPVHAADYDPNALPMRFRRLQSTNVMHYGLLLAALARSGSAAAG